ncbi:Citrate-binding protein [Vitis vinifera]|uniref:Citrate-binding protein n=1 Tax=Vitis vinifera TaxID=29760 RepID=A0A438CNJ0_VITVI|nr:Citrate-binding protein [Vitis vinifera]
MASFVVLALFNLSLTLLILYSAAAWGPIDPTEGFISLPLNQSNFVIQRPYDVPEDQRYSYVNGVHKLPDCHCLHGAWDMKLIKEELETSLSFLFIPSSYPKPIINTTARLQTSASIQPSHSERREMGAYHQVAFCLALLLFMHQARAWPLDPTHGFVEVPLNTSNFEFHKPYDLAVSQRYSFVDGVHKLWVFSDDKPLSLNSPTKPRSEIRIRGYDYSSGVWQFEAYGYVPCGTSGVCIMQVFGASPPHATTLMLRVYNGTLSYYRAPALVDDIYDRWFRLNVIHDVDAAIVKVYIDGVLKFEAPCRGGTSHYFKCGVYAQNDDSHSMESRWKEIKVLKKCV